MDTQNFLQVDARQRDRVFLAKGTSSFQRNLVKHNEKAPLNKNEAPTHPALKRVFRASHASPMPIATVTFSARRTATEFCSDNGGPGSL